MTDGKDTHAGSTELVGSPHDGVEDCSYAGLNVSELSSTHANPRLTSISGFSCRSFTVSFELKNLFRLGHLPAGAPSEMTMTKSGFLNCPALAGFKSMGCKIFWSSEVPSGVRPLNLIWETI
jgi:hypothetical protein